MLEMAFLGTSQVI